MWAAENVKLHYKKSKSLNYGAPSLQPCLLTYLLFKKSLHNGPFFMNILFVILKNCDLQQCFHLWAGGSVSHSASGILCVMNHCALFLPLYGSALSVGH